MKLSKRTLLLAPALLATGATVLAGCSSPMAGDDEYPSKTVKIIVPFAAGGSLDANSRILAECLNAGGGEWIIENQEGGGGTIGVNNLVSAKPDGYTLAYLSSSGMALTPLVAEGTQYTTDDLEPLAIVTEAPAALVVAADSPYETAEEFFAAAGSGEELSVATTGALGLYQLVVESLAEDGGVTPVPFDGTAPAVTAALGGNTDAVMAEVSGSTLESITAGDMRALATGSAEETDLLPGVPTFESLGYDLPESTNYGVMVGTGDLPDDLQEQVGAMVAECATDSAVIDTIGDAFVLDEPLTGDGVRAVIDDAAEQYSSVIEARG